MRNKIDCLFSCVQSDVSVGLVLDGGKVEVDFVFLTCSYYGFNAWEWFYFDIILLWSSNLMV
jgi:hypothetical protein